MTHTAETRRRARTEYELSRDAIMDALDWLTDEEHTNPYTIPNHVADVLLDEYRGSARYNTAVDDLADGEACIVYPAGGR